MSTPPSPNDPLYLAALLRRYAASPGRLNVEQARCLLRRFPGLEADRAALEEALRIIRAGQAPLPPGPNTPFSLGETR